VETFCFSLHVNDFVGLEASIQLAKVGTIVRYLIETHVTLDDGIVVGRYQLFNSRYQEVVIDLKVDRVGLHIDLFKSRETRLVEQVVIP
jgi:hypothetical protein